MRCRSPDDAPILVHIFLRGGADGLSLVPPFADDDYRSYRPTLGLSDPDAAGGALDLDGFFGLHPALSGVHTLWTEGGVTVLHGLGTDDTSRSHFQAQDRIEHAGAPGRDTGSGWLARHLHSRARTREAGPLTAIAFGRTLPESLRGAPSVTVLESLDELPRGPRPALASALGSLYGAQPGPLGQAGGRTLDALSALDRLRDAEPPAGAWPETRFGRQLRDLATLVRADVGLEIACLDLDGWDTHFVQDALFTDLARQLGDGLLTLRQALGTHWARTTVVVLSEFGRRVPENGSLGTDHGRGGAGFVLGGTVSGSQVLADWPGLAPGGVLDAHDVPVTLDARDVYAEVLCSALGQPDLDAILPGFEPRGIGVFG